MRRLTESWIQAEKEEHGLRQFQALEALNERLNMKVKASRVAEWRKGKHVPSAEVVSYMLYTTLPWALKQAGVELTEDQADTLDDLLWKDGENGKALL